MGGSTWVALVLAAWLMTACAPSASNGIEATPAELASSDMTIPATAVRPAPTATAMLVTPLPTNTATATPTPVVYIVQRGDTLLAIAAQFGVSAEAIQTANGVVDPRRLQIGQQLIIPDKETQAGQPVTPTPTPPPLAVRGINFVRSVLGSMWALGEVFNPGDQPLAEVVVRITLLDGAGQILAAETSPVQLDVVRPGQSLPFAVYFARPPAQFSQYWAEAISGVPTSPAAHYYLELSVMDSQQRATTSNTWRVSGRLQNTGSYTAQSVRLLVTGYDAQQRVVAVRRTDDVSAPLPPAASAPFDIELSWVGDAQVVTCSIQAQGIRAN